MWVFGILVAVIVFASWDKGIRNALLRFVVVFLFLLVLAYFLDAIPGEMWMGIGSAIGTVLGGVLMLVENVTS